MSEQNDDGLNRNQTIPIFDCDYHEFDHHLAFYTAMGFQITYYQKAPYRFAEVFKKGIGEFSFFGNRKHEEEGTVGGCSVIVPNLKEIYDELRANLKAYYGRIPVKGLPRISRMNQTAEDWRVNITDPTDNTIILSQSFGDSKELMKNEDERVRALQSKFERSFAQAYRFANSKEDPLAARNTLEVAFLKFVDDATFPVFFRAYVLQAEVYLALDQHERSNEAIKSADDILPSIDSIDDESLEGAKQRLQELKEQS
ncbi:hypothetical protein JCM19037_2403 [Geomicrobium sp. JCM 19037]|uniref:hypothetical protein n=1 Tax=unclassified Geomicrobium TaxID=2628951 RepID=UPI00045F1D38|nr:hypothetical protein [Geomicrobium sp. JCM 19037]GAK04032.1 hypothetical protein JCM19037_2403 [Geomicrobium sp. JCM 19037]